MKQKKEMLKKRKYFVLMLISFVFLGYGLFFAEKIIKPSIASMGEIKAKSMVVQVVNEVIRSRYESLGGFEDVLNIKVDERGKVTLIEANSAVMNKLSYDLAWEIQQGLKTIEQERLKVPLGSIFGNQIFSQTGPYVSLKILPLGTARIVFNTELTEAGINQTKYKVYIDVFNSAKVIVPFSNKDISVQTTLLIAEAIILGDIPDSYIVVPREDLMDAVDP